MSVSRKLGRLKSSGSLLDSALKSSFVGAKRSTPSALTCVEERQNHIGAFFGRTQHFSATYQHGNMSLSVDDATETGSLSLVAVDPLFENFDLRTALFVDTETTGLGVGAGNLPFLIGALSWSKSRWVLEQYFLKDPGHEAAQLHEVRDALVNASFIVSYNGKSFDWPLLRSRFIMHRIPVPTLPPHLDLLHCSRRLYKRSMPRVRLVDMEREVLAFEREDDISGAEIPRAYREFLRAGRTDEVEGIIEHNAWDLVSLIALARHLTSIPTESWPFETQLALAELACKEKKWGALSELLSNLNTQKPESTYQRYRLALTEAKSAKAASDHEAERHALQRALKTALPEHKPAIRLSLAKVLEHKLRDYESALKHAMYTEDETRTRRLERLRIKIARNTNKSECPDQ